METEKRNKILRLLKKLKQKSSIGVSSKLQEFSLKKQKTCRIHLTYRFWLAPQTHLTDSMSLFMSLYSGMSEYSRFTFRSSVALALMMMNSPSYLPLYAVRVQSLRTRIDSASFLLLREKYILWFGLIDLYQPWQLFFSYAMAHR